MATLFPTNDGISLVNATAVAVDVDKNSTHAVRWAIDHLVINNPVIVLLHVRHKNHQYQVVNANNGSEADEVQHIFVPYRSYGARKGVQVKEVVLDDIDVSRALVEYISENFIGSVVIGASTRNALNALTRKFKYQDVPSSLMKSAPDFCSVYVISKGKILYVRTAQKPVANAAVPSRAPSLQALSPQSSHDNSELDYGERVQSGRDLSRSAGQGRFPSEESYISPRGPQNKKGRNSPSDLSMESINISCTGPRNSTSTSRDSTSGDSEFLGSLALEAMDFKAQNLDLSISLGTLEESNSESVVLQRDLEAEMRRLKLELKQTIDMYSTACKEALSAKKKADELQQWKMEKARRVEEARLSEEAALAIAEMEKAKCKAAMEAAEKARRLAETEAQRRKHAEMIAKREAQEKNRALNRLAHNDVQYRRYTIEEIEEATGKFSQSMKIGEGGYGPVYKGKLDHTPVAIKVLRPDSTQGKKQFQQEVEVLSCIRHPNMVILLGACPEYGCLVYEFMDSGNLEDRLLRRGNSRPISWSKRFKIAAEIATALLFLHQAKPEPLVHRDLKPANILLDHNYVSKISDVGLARLVPPSVADTVTQYHMTSAAGTFCYIDPEYQQTGMLTTKSDIYSLGIMLLQIITAKPPMGLAHHVGKAIERGKFAEILDQSVPDWPVEEALKFAKLALQCAELRKKDRPSLATVILPELNQLRDLGWKSESHHGNSDSQSYGHGHRSCCHSLLQRSSVSSSQARISSASQMSIKQEMDNSAGGGIKNGY